MTAFCAECRKEVETKSEDVGIGSYEFWGATGFDSQWCLMCSECEGTQLWSDNPDEEPEARELTIEDAEPYYDDYHD